jgi:hypothetical protein
MPPKRVIQHGAQSQTLSSAEPVAVQAVIEVQGVKRKASLSKNSQEPVSKKTTTSLGLRSASLRMELDSSNKSGKISKSINTSKGPKKSVQFEPMEISSVEELTDDSSINDDHEQDMIVEEDATESPAVMTEVVATTSSGISSQFKAPKYSYNSMTKSMQVFKGSPDDHFETWEENTRLYLEKQCPGSTEDQRITAVKLKIQGYPRMILRQHPNIATLDDIFDALRPTYGADEITMLNEIKQMADESVRVYFSRLKTNLHLLGYNDSSKGNRIFLNHFINGLLPSLRTPVKALKPQKLLDAVAIAQEVESDRVSDDFRKKKSDSLNNLEGEQETSLQNLNAMQEKINSLEKQLADKFNNVNGKCGRLNDQIEKFNALSSSTFTAQNQPPPTQSNNYNSQRRNNNNSNRSNFTQMGSNNSSYQPKCFGCNQNGYSYQRCRLLTQNQKDQLRGELRDFYQAARQANPNAPANIANFKPSFSLNSCGTVALPQAPSRH